VSTACQLFGDNLKILNFDRDRFIYSRSSLVVVVAGLGVRWDGIDGRTGLYRNSAMPWEVRVVLRFVGIVGWHTTVFDSFLLLLF
jgi:hypothetical protein